MAKNASARATTPGAAAFSGNETVANRNVTAGRKQARGRPRTVDPRAKAQRASFSCGEPGVVGLCAPCDAKRTLDRLADQIAKQAAILMAEAGPSVPRLPVREHLWPKPSQLRTRPEFKTEWQRQPERGFDGWCWQPAFAVPALYGEAFAVEGRA